MLGLLKPARFQNEVNITCDLRLESEKCFFDVICCVLAIPAALHMLFGKRIKGACNKRATLLT
jgi:hypothetical protein